MGDASLNLSQLNALNRKAFVDTLGGVFEHSPWVADAAFEKRPFSDLQALHRAMVDALRSAGENRQLDLLRAHPELAGRQARAGELTDDSRSEQRSAGLLALNAQEMATIDALNARYRERFGFPFIVAVRNYDKASLLQSWRQRLDNDVGEEREEALNQVAEIARIRLQQMLGSDS